MKLYTTARSPGEWPIGALALAPLFWLPVGAWLVETKTIELSQCGLKRMVGLPCLSCGSTRATVNLLHGNIAKALAFQPMMMTIYVGLFVWGLVSMWAFLRRRSLNVDLSRTEKRIWYTAIVTVPLANWAYLIAMGV